MTASGCKPTLSLGRAERLLRTIAVVGYLAGPLPLLRRECSTSRPISILSCPLCNLTITSFC